MRKFIFILFFPVLAWGASTTITDDGNWPSAEGFTCASGQGRWAVYDGGSGYDSGTVTFQYKADWGEWENPCATASDCQTSSGNSGAVPFDLGADADIRLNTASVAASSADIDVEIVCLK